MQKGMKNWEIASEITVNEGAVSFQKFHGNAFQETGLHEYLISKKVAQIIVCGLVTHGCVKATCLGGIELGYKVSLLRNGHSCWGSDAIARINNIEEELMKSNVPTVSVEDIK